MFPPYNFTNPSVLIWLIPLIIWELIWKGIGLWKAGRNNQLPWFIAILIVNSVGILPILYMVFFQKKGKTETAKSSVKKRRR